MHLFAVLLQFERPSYEIVENIGDSNFTIRVCIEFNVLSERSARISTVPGTATGQSILFSCMGLAFRH